MNGKPPYPGNHELRQQGLQYLDALYNFARWLTHDAEAAADLVQETYTKALYHESQFQPGTNLKAWLFQILRNLFLNQRRQQVRRLSPLPDNPRPPEPFELGEEPAQPGCSPDARIDVRRALALLPEDFRLAVMLADVAECSHEEIARIVGCPTGTVKSRLARGRALLRVALKAYLPERTQGRADDLW